MRWLAAIWGGVATGRPARQRAARVLRCAPVLRMTRRPSLRSESSYGPCGPAWTGASRPSTTSRRTRDEQSARGLLTCGSGGAAEAANAGVSWLGRHFELGPTPPTPVSGDSQDPRGRFRAVSECAVPTNLLRGSSPRQHAVLGRRRGKVCVAVRAGRGGNSMCVPARISRAAHRGGRAAPYGT